MSSNKKIFGIGLAKTGTTSLRFALEILGFNHKTWDKELNEKYNEGHYEPIFHEAEKYDSFDDGPWNRHEFYQELDKRFPGSKFILTVRDLQSWIKSHEKHFSSNGLRRIPKEHRRYDYDENYKAKVLAWHKQRTSGVFEYFKERTEDLLIIDICNGEGWEKLCPFLGVSIPNKPFPHANITPKFSRLGKLKKAVKRLRYKLVKL